MINICVMHLVTMVIAAILLTGGDLGVDTGVCMVRMNSLGILHSSCSLVVSDDVAAGSRVLSHFACFVGFGFVSSSSLSLFVTSPDSSPSDSEDDSSDNTDLLLLCLLLTEVIRLVLPLLGSCKAFVVSLVMVVVVAEMVSCNDCCLFISLEVKGFGSDMVATEVTGVTASAYNGWTVVVLMCVVPPLLVVVSGCLTAANMLRSRFTEVGGLLATADGATVTELVVLTVVVVSVGWAELGVTNN